MKLSPVRGLKVTEYNKKWRFLKCEKTILIPPIPEEYLQMLTAERGVSGAELQALQMALGGQSTAEIATELGISNIAVRKRLGEVYRKFNITGAGPGKLAELKHMLLSIYQGGSHQALYASSSQPASSAPVTLPQRRDLSEAPDVPVFYGRTQEMATLEQWLLQDKCRLVSVLGLGGIGKTTLSVQIAKQIQEQFDFVIWQSLRNAPTAEELLSGLTQFLYNQKKPDGLTDINGRVSRLIEYLRNHKCLLILDDFENVLQSEELAGHYRKGYEGYGELLKRIAETNHTSCLMIVSSEKPADLALLEGGKVRSLPLIGSGEVAIEIIREKGLSGRQPEWNALIERYGGNPLAIKIMSSTIKELFNGNVADFLKNTLFLGDIRYLLDQQFVRLSDSEKEIMYWLAIEGNPLDITTLREESLFPVSPSELLTTLASLDRRSLIEKITEKGETLFTLQPLIMKYVVSQFVEQVIDEIREVVKTQKPERLALLKSHALNPNESLPDINELPDVLKLVKQKLETMLYSNPAFVEDQINGLKQVLSKLEGKSRREVKYAEDNIRTLLTILKEEISV
ncbi:NB-ARC domain-containing protein [Microcoleus sp. FACHB-672]|uniref:NB-ARC domain-containing protein n=1 Tax=Microcoleus sp. FACHB-672 TaxID=2692825 RepID=UPI002816882C|nr:NB-ARC domain-containing protein [Microcoleus sp. FACHB-672]